MSKAKLLYAKFNIIRSIPAILAFMTNKDKNIIAQDIEQWVKNIDIENLQYSIILYLNFLLVNYPEFRNIFYYRIRQHNNILGKILKLFYKPMNTLFINCNNIGAGLFIQHGFSTIISAKSIGENCWINQQVTIGYTNKNDAPTIGRNVRITAGAKIIGNVNIEDNSIVGANAVVVKNVPANCTVVGNPAYIVRKNGIKMHESLL